MTQARPVYRPSRRGVARISAILKEFAVASLKALRSPRIEFVVADLSFVIELSVVAAAGDQWMSLACSAWRGSRLGGDALRRSRSAF